MNDPRQTDFRTGTLSATPLSRAEIEQLLPTPILDRDRLERIDGVTTWDSLRPHRLLFAEKMDERCVAAINNAADSGILVITVADFASAIAAPRAITSHPRSLYARIVRALFPDRFVMQSEAIHPTARIAPSVQLSPGVVIGANCTIGEGTVLYPNVVLSNNVRIGAQCVIKSGTVIGQPGFGIYQDENGMPQHFPHVAGVVIGDHVELGSLNTVVGGTIHPTLVEDYVKTDDHVHIAHNCRIGTRTLLTACAELSGSVRLGADCWIGPNSSVRDGIEIGERCFVGIGSVVTKSIPPDMLAYGVPARPRAR